MNLPSLSPNAQEAAQNGPANLDSVAPGRGTSDSQSMVSGHTRARACNSIFRYPSPYGWSDGVPVRSPIFSTKTDCCGFFGRSTAENTLRGEKTFLPAAIPAFLAPEADRYLKGRKTCANSQRHFFARAPLSGWFRVAKQPANRPSLARVPVRPRPLFLAAACSPARLSAVRATSFIAKKILASVTNSNSSAATLRSDSETEAIDTLGVPVAFFVSTTRGLPAGQEPEGT